MLIKRKIRMTPSSNFVKNLGRTAALITCLNSVGFASIATAGVTQFTDRVITVEFKISELEAPNGIEAVYEKLKTEAVRACKADRATLEYTRETVSDCADGLLIQFIKSSNIESLRSYHSSQLAYLSEVSETQKT